MLAGCELNTYYERFINSTLINFPFNMYLYVNGIMIALLVDVCMPNTANEPNKNERPLKNLTTDRLESKTMGHTSTRSHFNLHFKL